MKLGCAILLVLFSFAGGLLSSHSEADALQFQSVAIPSYPMLPPPIGGREEGEVRVAVNISSGGTVVSAKAVSGPGSLRGAAENAAKASRFRPPDRPVDEWILTFVFMIKADFEKSKAIIAVFQPPARVEIYAPLDRATVIEDPPLYFGKKLPERKK